MSTNHIYLIYMYKTDLALNNLQWLICQKTQPIKTKPESNLENETHGILWDFEIQTDPFRRSDSQQKRGEPAE